MENYTICNCKNVTYFDVAEALHNSPTFSDVEKTFEEVKKKKKKKKTKKHPLLYWMRWMSRKDLRRYFRDHG